jgi:predicted RNA-binding protein with PIN domain
MYVIDGYNLMFALGLAPRPGSLSLERARLQLIDYLAERIGSDAGEVSVIFDAVRSAGAADRTYRGIHMCFSVGQTADDLIEEYLNTETNLSRLTVVSNDNRIRLAAQRRGCTAWSCGTFIDWMQSGSRDIGPESAINEMAKPEAPTTAELNEWLERFGE